ncbi:unnamed protein product, partial [Ectocarpus sp. 8 AP-2014]
MWGGVGEPLTAGEIHPGMEYHLAGVVVGRHAFDRLFFMCVCFVLDVWERWALFVDPFSRLLSVSSVRHVSCCDFLMAVRRESLFLWGLLTRVPPCLRHAARTWHGILRR